MNDDDRRAFSLEFHSVEALEQFFGFVAGHLSQPTARLRTATRALAAALGRPPLDADPSHPGVPRMRFIQFLAQSPDGLLHAVLDDTIATMQAAESVEDAALVFIGTVPAMIKAAVDQALANGATAEQLAPLTDLNTELQKRSAALQAALQPAPPAA